MNFTYLNTRCQAILQILLNKDRFITTQEIADELDVSQRSIYYDLCRVNEWLADNGIKELEVVRGKGLFLDSERREQIENLAEEGNAEDTYVFSPMERVRLIICGIIYSAQPVHIDKLTDYCRVSRNTIFNDLRVVVNQLQKYDLNLEYRSKKGYVIAGDAIKVRAVFLINFQGLQNLFTNNAVRFIDMQKVENYDCKLIEIQKELGIEYIEENRRSLAVLLPMMEHGDENLHFPDLKKEELESHREYKLVEKYFPQLDPKEKIYLCLHLLGGRIATTTDDIFENTTNEMAYEIAKALVAEFEKVACVAFERKEELERQLFVHLNSSLYRFQYGIQNMDSMNDDIIREYPDLFEITKIVSRYLERQIGLPVPDSEVAYLALHFGAYLPIATKKSKRIRVLIVCANGISTGNMLKREIKKMFPEVDIVGVKAATTLTNAQAACDMIISTVKLKCVVPVVMVHPILTVKDKEYLVRHFRYQNNQQQVSAKEIFQIVKPYIEKKHQEKVQKLLDDYMMEQTGGTAELHMEPEKKGLFDLISEERIEIHHDSYKWTQALWMAGEYLIDIGSIQSAYIESIISQLRYYGPYMFIMPRVILAHSKPEMGVQTMDCTIHFFEKPVVFSEKDQAAVVILLAAEDQESHLKVLRDLMTIFAKEENVDLLMEQQSPTAVLAMMKQILLATT